MTVYVTKYVLTEGIQVYHNAEYSPFDDTMVKVVTPSGSKCFAISDWHLNEATAKYRAREMVESKILSLNAQVQKCEKALLDLK